MPNSAIFDVIARPAGPWRSTKRLDCFAALAMTTIWMPAFAGMTAILSLFFINPSFATTSHNIYDAKGNMIASCGEKGCEYFIYQAVSRIGTVKDKQFTHQDNGLDGKAGEIVRNHNGVQSSQLWVTDFHGSAVAKLTAEEPEIILFDAFGGVLNESTNTEDCKDYHYTDKPRVGCTSLHNFNARFYDPKVGRFITTDPVEQHNLNWFAYANNNPLRFVDVNGKAPTFKDVKDAASQLKASVTNITRAKLNLYAVADRTLDNTNDEHEHLRRELDATQDMTLEDIERDVDDPGDAQALYEAYQSVNAELTKGGELVVAVHRSFGLNIPLRDFSYKIGSNSDASTVAIEKIITNHMPKNNMAMSATQYDLKSLPGLSIAAPIPNPRGYADGWDKMGATLSSQTPGVPLTGESAKEYASIMWDGAAAVNALNGAMIFLPEATLPFWYAHWKMSQ